MIQFKNTNLTEVTFPNGTCFKKFEIMKDGDHRGEEICSIFETMLGDFRITLADHNRGNISRVFYDAAGNKLEHKVVEERYFSN